uniref:uncharacterized protein LOC101301935 isoform X2 n=1 Tax=Fragaria vesca subsp. vesca TaxID=101020 RepID=UPI0005CA8DB8|nr:PREDICTED: uncharacterized protein LOC101301935 isoform X2 [Fragaria vesca subsp. vesca]
MLKDWSMNKTLMLGSYVFLVSSPLTFHIWINIELLSCILCVVFKFFFRLTLLHDIDKETDKPRGYAFAEYETEEIAEYAVRLFSGVVTLYNRTLRKLISNLQSFSLCRKLSLSAHSPWCK